MNDLNNHSRISFRMLCFVLLLGLSALLAGCPNTEGYPPVIPPDVTQGQAAPGGSMQPQNFAEVVSPGGVAPPDISVVGEADGLALTVLLESVVNQIAYDPSGEFLAAATSTGVNIFIAATLQELVSIMTSSAASSLAFSPDARLLAVGLRDNSVQLWRVSELLNQAGTERALAATFIGHAHGVWCVAFSPDGRTLASGSLDGTVRLWDVETVSHLHTLDAGAPVVSLAYSPDGRSLVSASWDRRQAKQWDVATGTQRRTLQGSGGRLTSVAYSPSGRFIAAGTQEGQVFVWLEDDGQVFRTLTGPRDVVYSVVFAPDDETLAAGTLDNAIWIWSLSEAAFPSVVVGKAGMLTSVAFTPAVWTSDADACCAPLEEPWSLALGTHGGDVIVWNRAAVEALKSPQPSKSVFYTVYATQPWVSILDVEVGQRVVIEVAGGSWGAWGGPGGVRNRAGGGGFEGEHRSNLPSNNPPAGALLGRIGSGDIFFVGKAYEFVASHDGRLYLGMNDSMPGDNSGYLDVAVSVTSP